MRIILLLLTLTIIGYMVMTQLKKATDVDTASEGNHPAYQPPIEQAKDVERLLQQSVDDTEEKIKRMTE